MCKNIKYSPDKFEPYPKLISSKIYREEQELIDSLSKYDSNLSFSDLKYLNLRGRPRDTSTFYKHCHKNLYLRTRSIEDNESIEWTNVTEEFDWDKILSNPKTPMYEFKK